MLGGTGKQVRHIRIWVSGGINYGQNYESSLKKPEKKRRRPTFFYVTLTHLFFINTLIIIHICLLSLRLESLSWTLTALGPFITAKRNLSPVLIDIKS